MELICLKWVNIDIRTIGEASRMIDDVKYFLFFLDYLLAYINLTCCIVDPHGTPKVNIWQDPLSPSKWKEEHVSNLWFLESLFLV